VAVGDLGEGTRLAALTGAWVCFEDEAGQALRPRRARTWAPRGHTPVVRVSGRSGRLPVAGMACLKPGRPGRFFYHLRVHRRRKGERRSLSEADYAHLISAAHHALGAPLILVWDGLNTHRSQKMRAFTEAREDWLTVVQHARAWKFPQTGEISRVPGFKSPLIRFPDGPPDVPGPGTGRPGIPGAASWLSCWRPRQPTAGTGLRAFAGKSSRKSLRNNVIGTWHCGRYG
jgi:DDE superfamily endonuclease